MALLGGFASLVKSGARLVGGLDSGLSKVFASLDGGLGRAVSAAVKLPTVLLGGIGKLTDGATGSLLNVAKSISSALGLGPVVAIAALAGALGTLTAALAGAVRVTTQWARSLNDLRGATGLSARDAGGVQRRFGAFGVDASAMLENQNPAIFGMKAGAYGLPNYNNANFLPNLAAQYQGLQASGPMGQMMARGQLQSLGLDNKEMRRIVTTPVDQIREQQNFAVRTQAAFKVDDGTIAKVGRDFDLLKGKVSLLGSTVLLKIGQEALPVLTRWADGALNIFEHFSGGAGALIERGVGAFTTGVEASFTALVGFGRFLYADLPTYAANFGLAMIDGLSAVVDAIPMLFDTFLTGLSIAQSAIEPFFGLVTQGFDYLLQNWPTLLDGLNQGVGTVLTLIQNGFSTNGFSTIGEIALNVFSKIESVVSGILDNPTFQSAMRAVGAGIDVVKAVGSVTEPVREAVRTGAEAVGVPSGTSDLLGFGAVALGGKVLLNSLVGGGAGSGAGGGLGGSLWNGLKGVVQWGAPHVWNGAKAAGRWALQTPPGRILTAGGALGLAGAEGLRGGMRMMGDNLVPESLHESISNSWTRIRNVVTGADYNKNVTQENGLTEAQNQNMAGRAARQSARVGTNGVPSPSSNQAMLGSPMATDRRANDTMRPMSFANYAGRGGALGRAPMDAPRDGAQPTDAFAGILGALHGAWSNAEANPGSWAKTYNTLPQAIGNWTGNTIDDASRNRGSWAKGLDARFGDDVDRWSSAGARALKEARSPLARVAGQQDEKRREYDEQVALLRQIAAYMRATTQNTGETAAGIQPFAEGVAARAMAYMAQDEAMNLRVCLQSHKCLHLLCE